MIQFYLAILTPCQPDGLLIKYPHFPEILNALIFNPIVYSYLQFDTVDYAPEPQTAETARIQSSSLSLNGISQNKTLCKAKQRRIYRCIYFHFASYVQHSLYCLAGHVFFCLPTTKNFLKFLYSEITGQSAWRVLFRPPWCSLLLWQLKVIRIGLTSILDF